ncbi:MAG: NUDIX hydrolase [Ignavibacteriae bacterium]|nr:NUDIX hydrolase [Ignavibacteriota bacterium]
MNLKLLKRNLIHQGRVFNTIVDDVEYPSGRTSIREVAEHPGGAVALAMFPDRKIILIKQHRYPIDKFLWELPAGKLEKGEEPLACVKRELEEESGYSASEWKKITTIYTTPGFCDEQLHLYLATNLTKLPDGRRLEEGEQTMTMEIVPLEQAVDMIHRAEIVDAKTIIAILLGEKFIG